ncbi:MAG TPA: methyltransferase domain-containing protein, partial [Chloroflexota bacterium]|nr:methyltransferase domain-containing protein [Chloroflexota bacterium]
MEGERHETYKRRIAGLYGRVAARYGLVGPPIAQLTGRRLVELVGVAPGARVLDVACGRGAALFPAAAAAGARGHVVGVDLAEPMVRETAAEIARRGLTNAEVRVMDAESLDLPEDSFDAVLCGFAVFFFPRLDAALRAFRRVLRPGGRVGISQARNVDPRWRWENELFARYGPPNPPAATAPGEDLRAPGELAARLGQAGFVAAREIREELAVAWHDADEWWAALWTHGTRLPL